MSEHQAKYTIGELAPVFVDSVSEVFETMVFMPVTSGETTSKRKQWPTGGIAGTVTLTDEKMSINLTLIFGTSLAKSIFKAMMGMEDDDSLVDSNEVSDVVGELANMAAGGAKTRLQNQGFSFKLGLPSVVVGDNIHLDPPADAQSAVAPIQTEGGEFYIELSC